jgi:hypothetical protein
MYVSITGNYIDLSDEGYIFLGPCLRHCGALHRYGLPIRSIRCYIGLSHWAAHHSYCVARLSHWVARPSYWVARLGPLPLWLLWQFWMLHSGLWQFPMLHSGLWQFPMLHSGLWQFPMLHSGLWQFWMLLVAILDVTMSSGVIMPRGPFGLSVLGQMQVLGKLYKMENPTCKIPYAIWTFLSADLASGPFSQSIVYG